MAALPPARTGIAPYTLAYLQADRWQTTFYEASPAARVAPQQGLRADSRVLPAEIFPAAAARGRHDTAVFVLGNSPHHAKVLDALLASRGCGPKRLAYLHEAALDSLYKAWLGPEIAGLPEPPAGPSLPAWMARATAAKPALGRCLRLLVERGELDGLLVNSTACRDLIRGVLGPLAAALPIDVVHLPIEAVNGSSLAPAATPSGGDGPLRIGSFGMAGDTKRLDVLVRAAGILGRKRPVRLVIAGWEAGSYCRRTGIATVPGVEVSDAPDDLSLLDTMRGVDVAVQLRTPTFGESSGVVNQLLALGTPLVVTGEGSFTDLPADATVFVAADCPPADLAVAIERVAGRRLAPDRHRTILADRSPEAFAARLASLVA